MATIRIKVPDMSCGGCTSSVTKALQKIDGISNIQVVLTPEKVASFTCAGGDVKACQEKAIQAISAAGFEPELIQ